MTSVILVQYNQIHLTIEAIATFRRHHPSGCEFIVVDNGSAEQGIEKLTKRFRDITLVRNKENKGFGAANNEAASVAKGDLLLFLNNDTIANAPVLGQVENEFARNPNVGVIGPRLLYPDGTFQLSAGGLPSLAREMVDKAVYRLFEPASWWRKVAGFSTGARNVGWVTGAALFIPRGLFLQVGGFDEGFFMYYEDKDLCHRVGQSGKKVRYHPKVSLIHIKAGSSSSDQPKMNDEYRKSQLRYYRKHRSGVENRLLAAYLHLSGKYPEGGGGD